MTLLGWIQGGAVNPIGTSGVSSVPLLTAFPPARADFSLPPLSRALRRPGWARDEKLV